MRLCPEGGLLILASKPISRDIAVLTIETVHAALRDGFPPPGILPTKGVRAHGALFEAARRLGIPIGTVQSRTKDGGAIEKAFPGLKVDWSQYVSPTHAELSDARATAQDAEHSRRQQRILRAQLAQTERALEVIAGLREAEFTIPAWIAPKRDAASGSSVVGALFTDLHMGEVIDGTEILGLNDFDPEIADRRAKRFFDAVCTLGKRWGADTKIEGALLLLGGDMISGEIHDELAMTNSLVSVEAVRKAVAVCGAGINMLKEAYGRVHVAGCPGNHGRTTKKPHAKGYARLSYDTLIYSILAEKFEGDETVTFQIAPGRDVVIPVFGRTVFLTHGDGMGTGGGQGFIGPLAPIVRGTKKVEAQQARANRRPDLICHGHYHTSANPGSVLSNGSVPGYSEYGNGLRASIEPPQQWAFLLHSRWWLRERCEVKLEDLDPPALPRVRAPYRSVPA